MNIRKYRTLIIMPYLPLRGYVKINGLILWSYQYNKDQFISDALLKAHIDKLTSCYQLHNGHAIQNPTIISVNRVDFTNPTRKSFAKVEAIKNIFLFTSVLENNQLSFTTSDNFEVYYQSFNVGDDHISTSAGAIHRITTGGYRIGQVSFVKPEHTHIPIVLRLNGSVINALEDCLINSSGHADKSRIIQSLNPFFNAYRNSHEHSWASRILLMIMAFELLFGQTGRRNFKRNIERYSLLNSPYSITTHNYPIIETTTETVLTHEQLTLNQIWAEEFYKLRNRIIHGDTIFSDNFIFSDLLNIIRPREPHFYIAVNFFVVCLLNKLRELSFNDVPQLIINPGSRGGLFTKNISGINNETFKIEDIGVLDLLRTS